MSILEAKARLISPEQLYGNTFKNYEFGNEDPLEIGIELINTMRELRGVFITGPQIGFNYNVLALNTEPAFLCFNPKIVFESEETFLAEEGCLTYPGLHVKVKRPVSIRCRFQDPNGETVTKTFEGMTAKAFCAGIDVLNGIKFYDRANRYHRELGFNKRKQLLKHV